MILKTPVPIEHVNFGIAGGSKYRLICKNHPDNGYRTKNPWQRSIFVEVAGKDCSCTTADLLVTYIPEDMPDEPFGGRHFKKGDAQRVRAGARNGPPHRPAARLAGTAHGASQVVGSRVAGQWPTIVKAMLNTYSRSAATPMGDP